MEPSTSLNSQQTFSTQISTSNEMVPEQHDTEKNDLLDNSKLHSGQSVQNAQSNSFEFTSSLNLNSYDRLEHDTVPADINNFDPHVNGLNLSKQCTDNTPLPNHELVTPSGRNSLEGSNLYDYPAQLSLKPLVGGRMCYDANCSLDLHTNNPAKYNFVNGPVPVYSGHKWNNPTVSTTDIRHQQNTWGNYRSKSNLLHLLPYPHYMWTPGFGLPLPHSLRLDPTSYYSREFLNSPVVNSFREMNMKTNNQLTVQRNSVSSNPEGQKLPKPAHTNSNSQQYSFKRKLRYSEDSLKTLEEVFKRSPYITTFEMEALAKMINVTKEQIKFWFQNRRKKARESFMQVQF